MSKPFVAGLLLAASALAACDRPPPVAGPVSREPGPLIMTRFVQPSSDQVWFALSKEVEMAGVARVATVPPTIPDRLAHFEYEPLQQQDGALTIDLEERQAGQVRSIIVVMLPRRCREPAAGDAARFRIKAGCEGVEYVEFVRQPAASLLEQFNFERPDGYTILGRRSIAVRARELRSPAPIQFHGKPRLELGAIDLEGIPEAISRYPEIAFAARLVRWLWSQDLRVGLIAAPYDGFVEQPFGEKLRQLKAGEYSLLCAGLRDLFLHAALSLRGLRVRAVGAYDYAPPFPHLLTFSHAISEIYVEALGKWVMLDPWMGIMITGPGDRPLSAEEIRREQLADLRIVPLSDRAMRWYITMQGGKRTPYGHDPRAVRFSEFTLSEQSLTPGYLSYFRYLEYSEATLSSGSTVGAEAGTARSQK